MLPVDALTSQTCGSVRRCMATLWRENKTKNNKNSVKSVKIHTYNNIHTGAKSVFTVMLMDRCDLLQQHLHLLTAGEGGRGGGAGGQASQSEGVGSDLNLNVDCTFCRWPAPPPAWPVQSAAAPAGSGTPGCRRRRWAGARGPAETGDGLKPGSTDHKADAGLMACNPGLVIQTSGRRTCGGGG